MRAIIFANGVLNDAHAARTLIQAGDLLVAADGGGRHCRSLELTPDVLIGDFDSIDAHELEAWRNKGVRIIHHPARKNFTDLELALQHAFHSGAEDIWVLAALGARWDQTLANLLLPASTELKGCRVTLWDGNQEIRLIQGGETLEIQGRPGDTLSLVPIGGDALGVTTEELEYPLRDETLFFGGTRGISNVLLQDTARVHLEQGLLVCVLIHQEK